MCYEESKAKQRERIWNATLATEIPENLHIIFQTYVTAK